MNVTAQLEFELSYYVVSIQHINHYPMETPHFHSLLQYWIHIINIEREDGLISNRFLNDQSNFSSGNFEKIRVCPHGVMVKVRNCRIAVIKLKLQLHYYVHFWTLSNCSPSPHKHHHQRIKLYLGKGENPTYLPSYELNSITSVLLKGGLWH